VLGQGLVAASRGRLLAQYVEVESGKRADRPELQQALDHSKQAHATLLIAKLDRLSRNVAFISRLLESGVDLLCCDMPQANRLTLHILAAVAEHERQMISERTKAALAAAKARGTRLGAARQRSLSRAGGADTVGGGVPEPDGAGCGAASRAGALAPAHRRRAEPAGQRHQHGQGLVSGGGLARAGLGAPDSDGVRFTDKRHRRTYVNGSMVTLTRWEAHFSCTENDGRVVGGNCLPALSRACLIPGQRPERLRVAGRRGLLVRCSGWQPSPNAS